MAFEYQGFSTLGVNLNRQKYGPLDISNVFNTQADFDYYLSKGALTTGVSEYWLAVVPYPYEGQIVALVTATGATAYILTTWNSGTNKYNVQAFESGGSISELTTRVATLEGKVADIEAVDTLILDGGSAPAQE